MAIAQYIRKRGFRKWYERELLIGHSHLVLLLLCTVGLIGALEAWSHDGAQRLLIFASALIAGGVGAWALRRYLFMLMRAELIANQASCPQCKAYARWQIEDETHTPQATRLSVSCKRCSHQWPIDW